MDIVYEDNHLIIVNKSAGELSQSDYTKDLSLVDKVKNYIKTKWRRETKGGNSKSTLLKAKAYNMR